MVDTQSVNVVRVVEPEVHLDEGFASLEAKHVPRLGLGEQLGDDALGELEDRLAATTPGAPQCADPPPTPKQCQHGGKTGSTGAQ